MEAQTDTLSRATAPGRTSVPEAPSGRRGLVFDIKRFALHDGPGIRTTVFFKGCGLTCWWCHNPESQKPDCEIVDRELKFDGHSVIEPETIGRWVTPEEVMKEVEPDRVFYEESGGGVTFSGGEPLLQPAFLADLLRACGRRRIHRALDTCGNVSRAVLDSVADDVDLFLYDVKLMDDSLHRQYTGASNRIILDNLRHLVEHRKNVVIRFPVVPGITDTEDNVQALIAFLRESTELEEIHLLPYHAIAHHKYERLRLPNRLAHLQAPSEARMLELKQMFEKADFSVRIGG